jgi:hypothetical protein
MRIDVERFLTITALLAAGSTIAAGCGSEDVENVPKEGGTVGAGGSAGRGGSAGSSGSGGRGGSSGSGGSAGQGGSSGTSNDASADTGGTAGTSGTGGSSGTGGTAGDAGTCLGDTTSSDAGDPACESLPYANATCGDAGDAPIGLSLCRYFVDAGRAGIYEALHECLMDITPDGGDPCAAAQGDAAQECVNLVLPEACPVDSTPIGDGGTITCAEISADCAASPVGEQLSEAECRAAFDAFKPAARTAIAECWIRNNGGKCNETFETCVFDPNFQEP